MSLSFNCPHCNALIVAQFLRPGEACKCHKCGQECSVPVDASTVGRPSSMVGQASMSAAPPPPVGYVLAGRGTRLVAQIVDALIGLPLGIIYLVMVALTESEAVAIMGIFLVITGVLGLVAYQWYLLSTLGQTIGKRMLNIKVVKLDGTIGGFVTQVLMRGILNAFIGFIPLYGLVDILFIFSEERRCIHDHIAGTRVIKVPANG